MLKSSVNDETEVNQSLIGEFKIKGDVKMFRQTPDYVDPHVSYRA